VDIAPLTAGDLSAVVDLCEQELVLDRAARTLPGVLMRRPHTALVAHAPDARLAGVCFGSAVHQPATRATGFIDLIVVDRAFQGRGTGRSLVAEMERQLASCGCQRVRIAGNGPYFAWPGIDIHYTAAICLAEDLGYRRTGCEVNMDVDLQHAPLDTGADEERLRREGIAIRSASPSDEQLLRRSVEPVWPPVWVSEILIALETAEGGLEIAVQDDQCVGFCAYGVRHVHEVGPVGTVPAARRHGIGAVLLRRCLSRQRSLGLSAAELVWAGPLSYFSRTLNARIGRAFWTYHKDLTGR
jgi:mycothiol synthase